jgi:hypothetical protein
MKLQLVLLGIVLSLSSYAKSFTTIDSAYHSFSKQVKSALLFNIAFNKKIDENNSFIELIKDDVTIHFGKYNGKNNEDIYVFNFFKDSLYYNSTISIGCYKYINDKWVEVTDEVMPMLTFNDFYNDHTAPPKSYTNKVQFRFILHKNKILNIVIEPNTNHGDDKFDRIFDQRKYAAVKAKWNKKEGRFEIIKWLK